MMPLKEMEGLLRTLQAFDQHRKTAVSEFGGSIGRP